MVKLKKPGGAFRRFIAIFCDGLILGLLSILSEFLTGTTTYTSLFTQANQELYKTDPAQYLSMIDQKFVIGCVVNICLSLLLFTYFEQSKWQATPGKKLLRLKVTDNNGNRLSFGQAFIRNIWYHAPTIPSVALFAFFVLFPLNVSDSLSMIGALIALVAYLSVFITWYSIWFLPILFTKNKTGLYEIFSNTRVLRR